MKIKLIIVIVVLIGISLLLFKLDVFRRMGVIAYSYAWLEYRRDYTHDPYVADPYASVWVFVSSSDFDQVRNRYHRVFGYDFVERELSSLSKSKMLGREFSVRRFALATGPFNYISIGKIQWTDGNPKEEVLVICGDVINFRSLKRHE